MMFWGRRGENKFVPLCDGGEEEGVCVGLFFLPLKAYLKVDILLPASPDLRILVIEGECWTAGLVHYLWFLSLQDPEGGDYPTSCLLGNARGEGKLPSWVDGLTSERSQRERNADVLIPCGPFLPSLTQKVALNRDKTVPLRKIVHTCFCSSFQPASGLFCKSSLPSSGVTSLRSLYKRARGKAIYCNQLSLFSLWER